MKKTKNIQKKYISNAAALQFLFYFLWFTDRVLPLGYANEIMDSEFLTVQYSIKASKL